MHENAYTSATNSFDPVQATDAPTASEKPHWPGCSRTRRSVLASAATLPALALPAVANADRDAGVVDLAHRLLAGIEAEYPLRLALQAAWSASERVRRQLLASDPDLRYDSARVHDLVQRTAQGRQRAAAYERWNAVCHECSAISQRILTETAHTGPGLAAQVLAYYYLERSEFSQSNGGPLLRAAVAMLGEKPPAHLNEDYREGLDRAAKASTDMA
jgi:hypothetical protein